MGKEVLITLIICGTIIILAWFSSDDKDKK
jgi:hypothetical protein